MSKQALIDYTLHLADNTLILAQRNSEWTGHGPILEQDIALSNIALDLLGQARLYYQYAARLIGNGATEDSLAYLRDSWDFKNCLLVELDKGDWAKTILRQFFFSAYQWCLYQQLQNSKDEELAGIAVKALKEVAYHLRWSGEWVIRLGDGTAESHRRIQYALQDLWPYTGELISAAGYEQTLAAEGVIFVPSSFKDEWLAKVNGVMAEATLTLPANNWMQSGGKEGKHTEHLGYVLAEMQYLQRTYPGNEW
ncbi:MAG: phenylacetate-CoA oxygenase subunit PaaC [Bacteroidetes bacterium]|nr:phenylacetate-CoA oxygenase subunit PaaC [Bacteroidota bacterium]